MRELTRHSEFAFPPYIGKSANLQSPRVRGANDEMAETQGMENGQGQDKKNGKAT